MRFLAYNIVGKRGIFMTINLQMPASSHTSHNVKPTITVIGVGGAGGNAVNNMIAANLEGVTFVVANTDAQALEQSHADKVIQLGASITQGLGAGAHPDVGKSAAEEAADEIAAHIEGSHMVFITAGMGGGTGTGAAPVIARMAKEQGTLTVAVVTKPFSFEGKHRMRLAERGLEELQEYVDTMIVIPNQNLFRIANEKTTFADAFRMADEVLHSGVRGVTDLMVMPGLINLDFADIRTVMREMGKAMMGTGEGEGERRAVEAAEAAISNPLLDDVSMKGARGVLINVTGGYDMTLFEVDEAASRIREEVDPDANIIFGSTFDEAMEGRMRVSVVATGIEHNGAYKTTDGDGSGARTHIQREIRESGGNSGNRTAATASSIFAAAPDNKATNVGLSETGKRLSATYQARQNTASGANTIRSATAIAPALSARKTAVSQAADTGLHSDDECFDFAAEKTVSMRGSLEEVSMSADHKSAAEDQPELFTQSFDDQQDAKLATGISPRSQRKGYRQEIRRPKHTYSQHDEESSTENEEHDNKSASGSGFIRRMASRFAPAEIAQQTAADEQPTPKRVEIASNRSILREEEDYLEIPAFLRRQAN